MRTAALTVLAACLLVQPLPVHASAVLRHERGPDCTHCSPGNGPPPSQAPSPPQQWIDHTIPAPALPPAPSPPIQQLPPNLAALWHAIQSPPSGDPIFDDWPSGLDRLHPGDLIQVRDVTATAGPLAVFPLRRALLLKFRSTAANGTPSFGTATLLIPAAAWHGGDRPVLVNTLPINSLGLRCTPGYGLAHGPHSKFSVGDLFPPTTWWGLERGYAVLVPDHEGPWMSYAEPRVAGHIVLDAIRATRSVSPPEFGASRFAVGGYSGGAIASYAAAMLQREYAPDLDGALVGASMGGLITDYRAIAHRFDGNTASGILLVVALAMAREHPDLLRYLNNLGRWAATSPVKDTCGDSNGPLGVTGVPIEIATNIANPLGSPLAQEIFHESDLRDRTSGAPLYIYHAAFDIWVPPTDSRDLFDRQCALRVPAVYRDVFGEHVIGMFAGFLGAIDWLDQRLGGHPAPSECPPRPAN